MRAARKPPWPPKPPGYVAGYGTCVWCGGAITSKNAQRRQWHSGRDGEPDCVQVCKLAGQSGAQRGACWGRDRGICRACGRDASAPWGFRSGGPTFIYDRQDRRSYPATIVIPMSGWHADHVVPLWSVPAGLPWAEAFRFWTLDNLQTLCEACHKAKSRAEARERARRRRETA